jgi:intraflagellar transport protein 52
VVQPDFIRAANQEDKKLKKSRLFMAGMGLEKDDDINYDNISGFNFVFPYGTTLRVKEPSIPILTTGSVCYPVNEVVMSMYESETGGKLFVLGSWKVFSDDYLEKEENKKIFDFIFSSLGERNENTFIPEIDENNQE